MLPNRSGYGVVVFSTILAVISACVTSVEAATSSKKSSSQPGRACANCASNAVKTKAQSRKNRTGPPQSPSCQSKGYVDSTIRKEYNSAMRDMKRAGIKPQITSTWRSSAKQAQLHRCSNSSRCRRAHPGLYRALPPGASLHEAGMAVDISGVASGPRGSKRLTTRGRRIVQIMRKNGFVWKYGLADPAHFEADPRKNGYKNLKQAIRRSQTRCEVQIAANKKSYRKTTPGGSVVGRAVKTSTPTRRPSSKA
jgi:D-alanyl-D-alanine carboxypeptidase-like protein